VPIADVHRGDFCPAEDPDGEGPFSMRTQKFSKVAVVRVGLGYMIFGNRDGATPSVGDGGSHLREEPRRVHRRRADRRVSDEWQSR
jgi:hypothetical protein